MRALQPTYLINSAADETVRLLQRSRLASSQLDQGAPPNEPVAPPADAKLLTISKSGFIQFVRYEDLLVVARRADVSVSLEGRIGNFYFVGEHVLSVWPAERCTLEAEWKILETLSIGDERTPEQDVEFGFRRAADIMLKAISPAINDPTTAEYCINTLGNLVILLGTESRPNHYLIDPDGTVRLIWKSEPFDQCVRTAFGQLRYYAVRDTSLVRYALVTFERVASLVPESRRSALVEQAVALRDAALVATEDVAERHSIEQACRWIST
jgi:uncharacterized membrane protein